MSLPLVLIVDDNPENLTVIGELLQPQHAVRAANSGRRALQLARMSPQPDLILLDVMMPEMDGYEVLRTLRAAPETAAIPVVFLTALNGSEDEERGLVMGAADYITKPIRPPVLLVRVRTQLELKRTRDTAPRQQALRVAELARQAIEGLAPHVAAIEWQLADPQGQGEPAMLAAFRRCRAALCEISANHPDGPAAPRRDAPLLL